jgi:DNA-directed RNA polymerase I subunit RPA2
VGEYFLKEIICVHLEKGTDKVNFLLLMLEKLYALVSGETLPDNLDSLQNQEILLPGHLYLMIIRESLE